MDRETVRNVSVKLLRPNPWDSQVGPPLCDDDYQALRASIHDSGIQIPLVAWKRPEKKKHMVVSGNNRLRIARQLKFKTVPTILRRFPDQTAAKLFALTDNVARRQLNTGQRAYLALQYQQIVAVGSGRRTDLQPSSELTKVDARQLAAERVGVSVGTVSAIKAVIESGDEELLQGVLDGTLAVHAAARYLRAEGSQPCLPAGNGWATSEGNGAVYTAVHGDNADLIERVAFLYLNAGDVICDVTVGQAAFWEKVDLSRCEFHGSDIALEPYVDLRQLPYDDDFADHLVLDPPYQHDVSLPITGARYNARRTVRKFSHDDIIKKLYGGGLKEAERVLKPGGLAWVKCCDEVVAGGQRWSHIEILQLADELGFTAVDLFILHRSAHTMLQHKRQLHARKNHSFLWMLRKRD